MRKRVCALAVFLVFSLVWGSSGSGNDFVGARPLALGRTFVGVADDANAIDWNPAGISSFRYLSIIASFNKEYMGISGDNIGFGHFAFVSQYRDWFGYGVSWRYLFSDVYFRHDIRLALAHKFKKLPLCAGLALRLEGVGYNTANFYDYQPGEDPDGVPITEDAVFANGTSKWGFSLDAGLLWRISPKFALGFAASDILQPNLSLQGVPEGKMPMHIRFGGSFTPNQNLLVAADMRYFKEGSAILTPHLGVEKWFNRHTIAARGGFNPDELSVGFGWRLNRHWALEIDYAFVYPLSKLAAAGANSHKFSAMFQIPNPIPQWDLEAISVTPQMERLKPGDEVKVTAVVRNNDKSVKTANYSVYVRKPDGTYALIDKGTIKNFKRKDERQIEFTFKDYHPGEYKLFVAIDDDGSDIPRLVGKINEADEGNNVATATVHIFPPPQPMITFREDTLHITRLAFQETEEPVIPVIFFEPKSAKIAPRYKHILDRLAARLQKNPDVVVKVAGYYDPESDGKNNVAIAKQRMEAVYDYLVAKVGNPSQVVKDESNDPSRKRAGGGKPFLGIEKYLPMIRAENRRVELKPQIPSLTQSQVEQVIEFQVGQTQKTVDFSAQAMTYKSILERNPDVMLLLEGYATEKEGPNLLEPAFTRAANLKEQLKKVVPFYLWDRIFAWGDDRHPAEKPHVKISLLADGVLYKPFAGRIYPQGEKVENPENFVQLGVLKADNPITSHRAELLDLAGNKVKLFTAGDGPPPNGMPWNWKTDEGKYIEAGKYYVGHITVTDELGAVGEAYSETLVVDQIDKVLGVETMLIVIFEFDRDVAISPYYHSRMEAVARRLIELAEHEPGELTVAVTGHTDIIGLSRRNQELSMERAQREFRNLKIYLRHLLNLPSEEALDKWLAERNVKLVAEGYGPDKPYTLKKMGPNGEVTEKLLGDNKLPEGREINRRVLVEFRSKLRAQKQ